jgi:urease accessory protein
LPGARSRLHFGARGGATALVECQASLPLVVPRPLHGPRGQVVATLLTPAGALFDGDGLDVEVSCDAGTDVTLTTAGASRLNRCDHSDIRVRMHVIVGPGAHLRYLPHETLAFAGARYRQSLELDLRVDARATFLDVIAPSAHSTLRFLTRVSRDGVVHVVERFTFRGSRHYGSLLLLDADSAAWREPPACGGRSALPNNAGFGVKALGTSAHALRQHMLGAAGLPAWLTPLLAP